MHLTPKDEDRLLLFLAAELARRRRSRGLALTYAEARALIADEVAEAARGGASVAEAAELGSSVLTEDDLLPGVPDLIGTVQVEGLFDDGQKLVTIHDAIRPGRGRAPSDARAPGELMVDDGEIELSAGRATATVAVTNTGDRPIQVGSHFHFFEANRALLFERRAAWGMHLDIPSGTAVRFEPGADHEVDLVAFGGTREIHGLNGMAEGSVAGDPPPEALAALAEHGFRDRT